MTALLFKKLSILLPSPRAAEDFESILRENYMEVSVLLDKTWDGRKHLIVFREGWTGGFFPMPSWTVLVHENWVALPAPIENNDAVKAVGSLWILKLVLVPGHRGPKGKACPPVLYWVLSQPLILRICLS